MRMGSICLLLVGAETLLLPALAAAGHLDLALSQAGVRTKHDPAALRQRAEPARRALSLRRSIGQEVRPYWDGCALSGLDINLLRTTVVFQLSRNGAVERIVSINTTGANADNQSSVRRFEDCARRAILIAAPFWDLPADRYDSWRTYTLDFERR